MMILVHLSPVLAVSLALDGKGIESSHHDHHDLETRCRFLNDISAMSPFLSQFPSVTINADKFETHVQLLSSSSSSSLEPPHRFHCLQHP